MSQFLNKTLNQLKVLILCGMVVIGICYVTSFRAGAEPMSITTATLGMIIIISICVVSLKIKECLNIPVPAFAWASLLALILTTPWSPVAETVLELTKGIGTLQVGTLILAVAGVSIGTKLSDIKKLSWKIILVSFVVFTGTFFGSALVSQFILQLQGII